MSVRSSASQLTVPLNGWLSMFYGVQVPVGIGFELEGTLEIAQVGFDLSANATATAELGLRCGAGACQGVNKFDLTRNAEFEKEGDLSADELERAEKELDKMTHEHEADINKALEHKEQELLEV